MPHTTIAANISASLYHGAPSLLMRAYEATLPAPNKANNQNSHDGRSPPRHTANKAVHNGSKPTNTMVWADDVYCKAHAVSKGKPNTTPMATNNSAGSCEACGRFCLSSHSNKPPKQAAISARALVTNSGDSSCTAMRVAGNEPEKMATPTKPLSQPQVCCFMMFFPL